MGNHVNHLLCSENHLRCTENCTRISMGEHRDGKLVDGQHCDPAGAVFDETLEELNDIDRQLLLFSSSSNVIAVRWLLAIGANRNACDSNATTCLHAACRNGSSGIINTLLDADESEGGSLAAIDIAGWTPLHVAVFMGRPDVVAPLLKAGASPDRRTLSGQSAADLCSDARTRDLINLSTAAALKSASGSQVSGRNITDSFGALIVERVMPGGNLVTSREVRFEPFFVPRNPVIRDQDRGNHLTRQLALVAQAIFNGQPGRGLSFLVASGCVRDYPIDLVGFLRNNNLDFVQIGMFLGEDFSLSKILRMEFINSVSFLHCGVVATLTKTFSNFTAPPDLQKVDRIIASLAEVWWRQHRAGSAMSESSGTSPNGELQGFDLKRAVPSTGVLHQLLFSSLLLHWNLHAPLPRSQRLSLEQWIELNRGIAGSKGDLPETVLTPIYRALSEFEVPHMRLGGIEPASAQRVESALALHARVEGWVRIRGSGLPVPLDGAVGGPGDMSADCLKMSSMLSEATASSRRRNLAGAQELQQRHANSVAMPSTGSFEKLSARAQMQAQALDASGAPARPSESPGAVWLTLCQSVLFFSVAPGVGTPFAFIHLRTVQFTSIEPPKSMFAIDGGPSLSKIEPSPGDKEPPEDRRAPLQLVFLLPDGRWQSYDVPKLVLEVCDHAQMEVWVLYLTELCSTSSVIESLKI